MRVLLTGAAGFIGSQVAARLVARGHEVHATLRDNPGVAKLRGLGLPVSSVVAPLEDTERLAQAAASCDAVVHLAFDHRIEMPKALALELHVLQALTDALAGTNKPLVATSATGVLGDTGLAAVAEDHPSQPGFPAAARRQAENYVVQAATRQIRTSVIRVPLRVHSAAGGGPIARQMAQAHKAGVSRYIGTGENRLASVHLSDLAELFVLAMESAPAGSIYNGAGGDVGQKECAEAIARRLGIGAQSITREQAMEALGPFFTLLMSLNNCVSHQRAHDELGWRPYRATSSVIEDIAAMPLPQ